MNNKKLVRAALVGAAVAAMVAGTATAAVAETATVTPQSNGSDAGVYVFNQDAAGAQVTDTVAAPATSSSITLSPSLSNPFAPFHCPADATQYKTFVTAPGTERTISAYKAWADTNFANPQHDVAGADIAYGQLVTGTTAAVKAAGGNWSFGLACVKSNGVQLATSGVWYYTAHVTAGTGNYTVTLPELVPVVAPTGTQGSIAIQATTIAAQDGVLSLSVPANATATLGTASLVNQLSTSTGTLPTVKVTDQRVVSTPGWDLTTTTTPFVNAADATKTIAAAQLGVKPALVAAGTNSTGVTVASGRNVGDTTGAKDAFASAPAGSGIGDTNLNAALTFVAPANAAAGTYNSTMTLTVVSK